MNTGGWVLDAPADRWLRLPTLDDDFPEGRTVVGTDHGALAFGGAEWPENGNRGTLVRDAWLWSAG